jgi:hypothetical protein
VSFTIGTVECRCTNVMGMPTDSGKCTKCEESKTFFGEKSLTRLQIWAEAHSTIHQQRFLLDGKPPKRIVVREVTPEGHATRIFAVVADHGWAERILASDCYQRDANDLAWAIGNVLDISIEEANEGNNDQLRFAS